ncbi:hypothetical protein [uncultured Sneathiella sp.]|uniref:protein kinase domain-containing protein n=1 Tax=uncultured Sneathiella sp. TaxID=879315 RepID=UPI0030EB9B54|tara:strand:+ start:15472 stop:17517 length:2046 start_codon:yes stop_codon:yes gene_type:complete
MSLAETMESETEPVAPGHNGVLRGRYRVDLSRRLDFLASGENLAVQAFDTQDSTAQYFAVISNPYSVIRQRLAERMSESLIPGTVELLARGAVAFSDSDTRYVSVFEMPRGGPFFNAADGPVAEKQIFDQVLTPVAQCLAALHKVKLTHRGIRADNLFFADDARQDVVLGEAITSAPGSGQPMVYETLENAMAHPMARGEGGAADDLYAVGVLIVHLLGGAQPAADMSAEEIFAGKCKQGSFAFLTEGMTLSQRVSDLLAGLLQDDPQARWTTDMLVNWREKIKDTPRRGRGDRRGFSKLAFGDEEYNSPRLLVQAMRAKPMAAMELLKSGQLAKWVKSALREEETAAKISHLHGDTGRGSNRKKRNATTAVAQATYLLDPEGPFWFNNVSFSLGGLDSLVLWAFHKDDTELKKSLTELFESGILLNIVTEHPSGNGRRLDWISESELFVCMEHMRRKKDPGAGLERCLYELNRHTPCLSPLMLGYHVRSVREFIEVAEKKMVSANGQANPFDRHAAGFIAAKTKGIDQFLQPMSGAAPGSADHALIEVKLFARLQSAVHPGPLPGFCRWAEEALKPVFSKFKSRLRREVITQKFQSAKKSGSLIEILKAMDIDRQLAADAKEYHSALATAGQAERMAAFLANGTEQRRQAAARYGAWITSVLAITSLVSSMVVSALYFIG